MLDTVYASDWQIYIYKEREREREMFFLINTNVFPFSPVPLMAWKIKIDRSPRMRSLKSKSSLLGQLLPGLWQKKQVNFLGFLGKHWDLSPFKHKAIRSMVLVYMLP
jgi:hypothetical protein